METQDWYKEKKIENITLEEFEQLNKQAFQLNHEIKSKKTQLDAMSAELLGLKLKIKDILDGHGKDNYTSKYGLVGIRRKTSVSFPKEPEAKAEFLAWLESKNMGGMLSVNSQALNAMYKAEWEANNNDPNFEIPGLGTAKIYEQVYLKP